MADANQKSLFSSIVPAQQVDTKSMSHSQLSDHKIKEARAGRLPWSKVTDRDFTLYYQQKHEEILGEAISYFRNDSVTFFRDSFLKKFEIKKEEAADFIDTMLSVYRDKDIQAQKWHSLTFKMMAEDRQQAMLSRLVTRTRYELTKQNTPEPVEERTERSQLPKQRGEREAF